MLKHRDILAVSLMLMISQPFQSTSYNDECDQVLVSPMIEKHKRAREDGSGEV